MLFLGIYGMLRVVSVSGYWTDICLDVGSMLIIAQGSFEQCTYSLGVKTTYIVEVENATIIEV